MTGRSAGVHLSLLLVLVAPLAAVVLLRAVRDDELAAFSIDATPLLSSPTARTVTDERQLRIMASAVAGPAITAGSARGLVTAVAVHPGDRLMDGGAIFQVDGVDRVAFVSSAPFYRQIFAGSEGADVAELHRLLAFSGVLPAAPANPRVANLVTGQAIAAFAERIGAGRVTTFDPAWVVWLPEPGLVAESVKLMAGQPAPAAGTVIITTPGRVTSARLASGNQEPLAFATGVEYVAVVDGQELRVDNAEAAILSEDLVRLRTPKETERDGIPALTRRKTPLSALAVPSSAVMTNERGALCVWLPEGKEYRAVGVTVAGARGGVTNVATGLEPSQRVLSNPAGVLEEPQCP